MQDELASQYTCHELKRLDKIKYDLQQHILVYFLIASVFLIKI